jgi:hypothetical protein
MSCSEHILSAILSSSIASVLLNCSADLRSSPSLCWFFFFLLIIFIMAIETITFHSLSSFCFFFVFVLLLLTFQKGRMAVGFSTRKTENTPVFYNSEALHDVQSCLLGCTAV